jgi:hypothetical protein
MQVCLSKHNYKLDNNLLTVEPRAVDPHCFHADADPDPAQNLDAKPDPDPGGGGRSAKNVHPPWQNLRYAPAWKCLFHTVFIVAYEKNHSRSGQLRILNVKVELL